MGPFRLEEEDIQKPLDIVKTSFEFITGETAVKTVTYKKDKKDKPGTYEPPELKFYWREYLSQTRKTANRIKKIVLPLCLEYDIVTREMIKEKLVLAGEASNIGNAGLILHLFLVLLGDEIILDKLSIMKDLTLGRKTIIR